MKLVKRIVLAALFLLSGVVFAETPTKTVEAEGMGETLELAMKNARENAVRKAFGEVVDSVTEVKNDQLIESTISASSGFVVSSQVLGAQFDEKNKIYTVKTRTVVATERMKAQINRFKKSTASVDIGSMLEAADAKIQEKNAMKILLYLLDEIPKLYRLESHEIGIDADGRLWLKYHCDYDKEQLERVYKKAGDALRGNGYENDRGTIRFCEGSWVTNDFRNENVILFWNHKEHKDHPQNLYRFFPYDELIIKYAVMDAQSKILAEDSRGRIVEIVRGSPKDPSSIKFQPQSFSEQPTFDKLAGENLKKVAKIIFFVDY